MGVIGVMGFRVWRFRDLNSLNFGRIRGSVEFSALSPIELYSVC